MCLTLPQRASLDGTVTLGLDGGAWNLHASQQTVGDLLILENNQATH